MELDYDREINDKLQFLKEQSRLAEILGIAKNTLEVRSYGDQDIFSSFIQQKPSAEPYYLKGYEAINGEIKLISTRTDKKPFITGLVELEQKKEMSNKIKR